MSSLSSAKSRVGAIGDFFVVSHGGDGRMLVKWEGDVPRIFAGEARIIVAGEDIELLGDLSNVLFWLSLESSREFNGESL